MHLSALLGNRGAATHTHLPTVAFPKTELKTNSTEFWRNLAFLTGPALGGDAKATLKDKNLL